jgi:hypothetical protein
MRPSADDFLLTPEARFRELAEILATGILRILARPVAMPPADSEKSSPARLQVPDKTVRSVHAV